jgi:hypothetical protein
MGYPCSSLISKRRNCLDANIIELLQCLKSLISREDLMLRSYPSLADEEFTMDNTDRQCVNQDGTSNDILKEAAVWDFEAISENVNNDDDDDEENDDLEVLKDL